MDWGGVFPRNKLFDLDFAQLGYPRLGEIVENLRACHDTLEAEDAECPKFPKIPLWEGKGECIRSIFCTSTDSSLCQMCKMVECNGSFRRRCKRLAQRGSRVPHPKTRNDFLSNIEVRNKLQRSRDLRDKNKLKAVEAIKKLEAQNKRVVKLQERLKVFEERDGMVPKELRAFADDMMEASRVGALDSKPALMDILQGLGRALRRGGRKGTKLTMNEYAFYSTLLSTGGSWVAEFVSKHLQGPHVDTIRRLRNKTVLSYEYGDQEWRIKAQVSRVANLLKKDLELTMKGIISEDGSALLDYLEAHPNNNGDVELWGLSGGPVRVSSLEEYSELLRTRRSATTFYPYLWVPLAPGAKAIPLMVLCHDNTKDEMDVPKMIERWRKLWRACVAAGLEPVAHYGDGDRRFRGSCIWLGIEGRSKYSIKSPLVNLHVREDEVHDAEGGTVKVNISAGVDPLHINWRVFRSYLDAKKALTPGGMLATSSHLTRFQKGGRSLGINYAHLNFNNKTNFPGVIKVSDHKLDKFGGVVPANNIRSTLRKHAAPRQMEGDLVFLEFFNKLVGVTWVKCRRPVELIHDLVWIMLFCLLWEEGILKSKAKGYNNLDLKKNCLSRETLDDISIYCQEMLLGLLRQQRENPEVTFLPDRRASRFSEYFFGDMRMAIRGQMKFSSKSALRLMQIALTKYTAEMNSDVITMSLRKYKHNEAEEKLYRGVPDGYWEFDMEEEIDKGVDKCLTELKKMHFDIRRCTPSTVKDLDALKDRDSRWKAMAKRYDEAISGRGTLDDDGDDAEGDVDLQDHRTQRGYVTEGGGVDCVEYGWQANDGEWMDRTKLTPDVCLEESRKKLSIMSDIMAALPLEELGSENMTEDKKKFLQVRIAHVFT